MSRDHLGLFDNVTKFQKFAIPVPVPVPVETDHLDQHWLKKGVVKQTKDGLVTYLGEGRGKRREEENKAYKIVWSP